MTQRRSTMLAAALLLILAPPTASRVMNDPAAKTGALPSGSARKFGAVVRLQRQNRRAQGGKGGHSSRKKEKSASPSLAPSTSPAPSVSPEPSEAPSSSPSHVPTASPSANPTNQPSASPTLYPSFSPSISNAPTTTFSPTSTEYERTVTMRDDGLVVYETACELPANTTAVRDQVIAFDYQITLADASVDPASKLNTIEGLLNGHLSREYMSDCDYSDTSRLFHTLSMSSTPEDSVGQRCSDGTVNCYTVHAAFTTQIFYLLRRNLQETITDPVILEGFGSSLSSVFDDSDLFTSSDSDIQSVEFVRITNFAQDGTTFGGVDPDDADAAGITGEREQKSGNPSVAWASAFLACAVLALVVVAVVVLRRRRVPRRRARKEALERTKLEDDELFTFDDEIPVVNGANSSDDDTDIYVTEEPTVQEYVVGDHMTDTGDSVVDFAGVEVESNFRKQNSTPPVFVPATDRDDEYDPYGSRKYSTPDTLDL